MFCTECGNELKSEKAKFCGKCGAKVEREGTNTDGENGYCPCCGDACVEGQKYCAKCGMYVEPENNTSAGYCENCGTQLFLYEVKTASASIRDKSTFDALEVVGGKGFFKPVFCPKCGVDCKKQEEDIPF